MRFIERPNLRHKFAIVHLLLRASRKLQDDIVALFIGTTRTFPKTER